MTFPSALVPKTTNKTAGSTPYPSFLKRKLEYGSNTTGVVQRKLQRTKFLSVHESMTQNKMWYDILPDGVVCFYAAQGTPDGTPGFLAPLPKALVEGLSGDNSRSELLNRIHVTSVLPLKDLRTGGAKKKQYANGTRECDVKGIVYVFDNIDDNNSTNCDVLCTNLVREAFSNFDIKIWMGGNAEDYGAPVLQSLDSKFLTKDVANLAMMSYRQAITDKSFFDDDKLVSQYFLYVPDVRELFSNLFDL